MEEEESSNEEEPTEDENLNEPKKSKLAPDSVKEENKPESPLEEPIDPVESEIKMWEASREPLTIT